MTERVPQAGVKTSAGKACLGWLFDEKKRGQIWVGDERLSGGAEGEAEGGSSQSQDGYVYAVCRCQSRPLLPGAGNEWTATTGRV